MKLQADWKTAEYGSHWAAIESVFTNHQIRNVLETGSGLYSTPLFLKQDGLESLVSIENNPEWALEPGDDRHTLKLVTGRVADHLPDLAAFDLVFVDDDPVPDRVFTIRAVLARTHPVVVIHDTDYSPFGGLLAKHEHETFKDRRPWTSVVAAS